jgi:Polyketide cyclase / dehydrase and lipid transport
MSTSEVVRDVRATPGQVWRVLADGWLYGGWVVGASTIRDVDVTWPEPGAKIHHSSGMWPLLLSDTTVVLESRPEELVVLQAKGWPLGEATVRLLLEPVPGGTRLRMREDASRGPGRVVPGPLRQAALRPRNRESLRRLALIAENKRN